MKVLIIGLGSIAQKHIAALNTLGGIDIFALRSSGSSEKFKNVTNIYCYDEIKKVEFDFFLISNPTSKHAVAIEKLLVFKKPMFIEKPLFHAIGLEYYNLVQEVKKAGIKTYIACNLRFLDLLSEIKSLLADTKINEVNIYCGSYLPSWRPSVDYRKVYSANKDLGGGVHLDLIHELDYLYWLFGEPENVSSTLRSTSSLDIDVVDYANYLWEYNNFSANIVLNYYRRDAKRSIEIVTAEDTFYVDVLQNNILKNKEEIYVSSQAIIETYTAQMKYFIDKVVKGQENSFNDIEEAYKILNLCLKE